MLIGVDLFAKVMDGGKVSVYDSLLIAFGLIFGWIFIGLVSHSVWDQPYTLLVSLTVSIEEHKNQFWRVEELAIAPLVFIEEGKCKEIFEL